MSAARRTLTAIAGGAAMYLAFPNTGWWPMAIVALGLLYTIAASSRPWAAFGAGWLFGMVFMLPHIWWIYTTVGVIPWIALCALEALAMGLAAGAFSLVLKGGLLGRARWLAPVAFAVLWTGGELLRAVQPFGGFPWGRVAFAFADAPLGRLAWLGGVPLVSLVGAVLGGILGAGLVALGSRKFVGVLAAPVAIGVIVLAPWLLPIETAAQSGTANVGWVQGNVPNEGLDSFNQARAVTLNHLEGTQELAASTDVVLDLVVWPENSSDVDPRVDGQTAEYATEAAQTVGAPLVMGTIDYSPPGGRYNSSLVWLPDGTAAGEYRKQRPAAFAEYIPIRDIARRFSDEVDRVSRDMIAGTEPAILWVPVASREEPLGVGPIICFEVAYDSIAREAVTEGAEFLVIQTNNATFGLTAESTQQLAMSQLRAIETGRATIQVSTVGVSAVIRPDGQVEYRSTLFTRDYGVATLDLRTSLTPAVRYGGAFQLGLEVAAGALAMAGALTAASRRERP